MSTEEEDAWYSDMKVLSDNQLIDFTAHYNVLVRKGRRLVAEGEALISANNNLFVLCQGELNARMRRRLEDATEREERGA